MTSKPYDPALDARRCAVELEASVTQNIPGPLDDPVMLALLFDRLREEMRVVVLPHTREQFHEVTAGYPHQRGKVGLFVSSVAATVRDLPWAQLEQDFGRGKLYEPGCELLLMAMLSECFTYTGEEDPGVTRFSDLPVEDVTSGRSLAMCDGRGTSWRITRDLTEPDNPVLVEAVCLPDPANPIRFLPPPGNPDAVVGGGVAWGLAVLAMTFRERLEVPGAGYPTHAPAPHNGDEPR